MSDDLTVKKLVELVTRRHPEYWRLMLYRDGSGQVNEGHLDNNVFAWSNLEELEKELRATERERAVERVLEAAKSLHHSHGGDSFGKRKELDDAVYALEFLGADHG